MLVRRHGVLDAHHELDMRRLGHQPGIDEAAGAMDVREIENSISGAMACSFIRVARSTTSVAWFS